jgi:positive regulator of sigma E activity
VTGDARPAGGLLRPRLSYGHPEATASAVYGLIVSAAVIATSHARTAIAVDAAVLVTLVVYWAAERYARIIAERIHEGHRPAWHTLRRQITTGWELVTASLLPLVVLVVVRVAGARLDTAQNVALVCSTLLLAAFGWRVGAQGRLDLAERLVAATVATAFGATMIAMKAWLH